MRHGRRLAHASTPFPAAAPRPRAAALGLLVVVVEAGARLDPARKAVTLLGLCLSPDRRLLRTLCSGLGVALLLPVGAAHLALEQPFQTAALFSLAGVNSILMNQWSTSLHANQRLVREWLPLMKNKELHLAAALQKVIRFNAQAEASAGGGGAAVGSKPNTPASRPGSKAGKKKGSKAKGGDTSTDENVSHGGTSQVLKQRVRYNTVVYGLPHAVFDK